VDAVLENRHLVRHLVRLEDEHAVAPAQELADDRADVLRGLLLELAKGRDPELGEQAGEKVMALALVLRDQRLGELDLGDHLLGDEGLAERAEHRGARVLDAAAANEDGRGAVALRHTGESGEAADVDRLQEVGEGESFDVTFESHG